MFYIKLKYLREKENLTREQLAGALDITYSTLSKYETNKRQPDFETLKKIASFFSVSTDYLLDMPFENTTSKTDIVIHFEFLKDIVKNSNTVYFNDEILTTTSKNFIYDSIEYISNQIENINNEDI